MNEHYKQWQKRDPDPETKAALQKLVDDNDTAGLARAFGKRLKFGTAGLRGVMGPGPSQMNRLVVRETAAGLGAYLLATIPDAKTKGVCISYDGRKNSRTFAQDACNVLAAMGFKQQIFDRGTPTPVLSFSVRDGQNAAGIMITASHNPPEYNGLKIYWHHGAQIVPPHDAGIEAAIEKAAREKIPWMEHTDAFRKNMVCHAGDAEVSRYLSALKTLSIHQPKSARQKLTIAYTPLHGVGAFVAEKAMTEAGFQKFKIVRSQEKPDGAFPTVRFPNPEEPGSMDAVLKYATELNADLACANDPDADRFAVAVREASGTYRQLSGDEVGILLGWDRMRKSTGDELFVTTIVSSRLLGLMAKKKKVHFRETLTGFKWIAQAAFAAEDEGAQFVFGYEEALGYAFGDQVRDKDGIAALLYFCELCADLRERGQGPLGMLEAIYREHGLYKTAQRSIALSPEAPSQGDSLRQRPPEIIAGRKVLSITDLRPKSDVLIYELEGAARVIVRPSGTEPKIKCYYEVGEKIAATEPMPAAQARVDAALTVLMDTHQAELAAQHA